MSEVSVLDYSKWDNIWVESDDDEDCHPNIEKYAWRRLKARMREDKGEEVFEPELRDKWSSTAVNREATKKKTEEELIPEQYITNHREEIDKYANTKKQIKANAILMAKPHLVSQLTEGYLITKAVDIAVEDRRDKRIDLYARRCLQVHNINVSAQAAKMKGNESVPLFFRQLKNEEKKKQYETEFEIQLEEILGRIETRRQERLEEAEQEATMAAEAEDEDFEPAPVGPGGLDPTEVLQSLPESIQQAFVEQDKELLVAAFNDLPAEEANEILSKCIDAGLWNANPTPEPTQDESMI